MRLLLALLVPGCVSSTFSERELTELEKFQLPDPAPVDTDDPLWLLGRALFFDAGFSVAPASKPDLLAPSAVSCVSCHDIAGGGADVISRGPVSLGMAKWTSRNAPTLRNVALRRTWPWDGGKHELWQQNIVPFELGGAYNSHRLLVARRVADVHAEAFEAAFGPLPELPALPKYPLDDPAQVAAAARFLKGISGQVPPYCREDIVTAEERAAVDLVFEQVGRALQAFVEPIRDVGDSRFDRALFGDEPDAMSESAIRGAKLFVTRASCVECHRGPLLTDEKFHNVGVPQTGEQVPTRDVGAALPVELAEPECPPPALSDPCAPRGPVSECFPSDAGKFRTPSLRGLRDTGPFMHAGQLDTLWDVVDHYRFGGHSDGFVGERDVKISELALSDTDVNDLVDFLLSLEGEPLPDELVGPPEAAP